MKGAESEVQRLEVKENPIPKTKDHRFGEFLYSATKGHSSMPPSSKNDKRTGGGGCGGYVNMGGCVTDGRPGI